MTPLDLRSIEASLGVVLPSAYKEFMATPQSSANTSFWDDADEIIKQTKAQRKGFGGAPPWPADLVVIGDEEDACLYALDCRTGTVVQTDHGNLDSKPLATFGSVAELIEATAEAMEAARKPWWRFW